MTPKNEYFSQYARSKQSQIKTSMEVGTRTPCKIKAGDIRVNKALCGHFHRNSEIQHSSSVTATCHSKEIKSEEKSSFT